MNIVILVGGGGSRLWPMSQKKCPKQFNALVSELTLFEETFNRFKKHYPLENIFVSATRETYKIAQKILPQIPKDHYIIEPEKRDTGPALAYAASFLSVKADPNEPMVFICSDHYIKNPELFVKCLKEAEKIIKKTGKMMDIAIAPTFPNINLGYTRIGKLYKKIGQIKIYEFKGHKEKPDLATAKKLLASGEYLWHASFFMWTPQALLAAYKKYAPKIYGPMEKIIKALKQNDQQTIEKEFSKTEKTSIDYAVAEKMDPKDVLIIKGEFGWSDIGSWNMLYDQLTKARDKNNNLIKANSINIDTSNSLIYGDGKKLIATIGLDDLVIVDTKDALLVGKKEESHLVKKIVKILEEQKRNEYL